MEGDSIYNGALDNASGTAQVLAIAKNLSRQKEAPKRSILFAFVTAEEQGLLGSEYYALNPSVPVNQIVANINVDGCNPNGPMKDFQIIGYGHSEMDDIVAEELKSQDRYVLPIKNRARDISSDQTTSTLLRLVSQLFLVKGVMIMSSTVSNMESKKETSIQRRIITRRVMSMMTPGI